MLRSIFDLKIGKYRVLYFFIYFHEMKSKKCSGSIPGFWGFTVSTLAGVGSAREGWNLPGSCKAFAGSPNFFFTFSDPKKLFLIFPDPQNVSQRFPIHTPVHVYSKVVSGLTDWKLSKPYFCRRNWLILGKYFKQVYHSSTV